MTREMDTHLATGNRSSVAGLTPQHFGWRVVRQVGVITLNRPERKNPLTFDSYAELRDLFGQLKYATDVHAIVVAGAVYQLANRDEMLPRVPKDKMPAPPPAPIPE